MRLVAGPDQEHSLDGEPLLVGSSAACDVVLAGAAPKHARVASEEIEALEACMVGGVPLARGGRRALVADTVIGIGDARIIVRDDDEALPTREVALRMVARRDASTQPRIIVVQGSDRGAKVELLRGSPSTIGRAPDAGLKLADEGVSRAHVAVTFDDGVVLVKDLGATQGSFLGEKRLELRRNVVWSPDTMLRLGDSTVLALVLPAAVRETTAAFIAERRGDAPPVSEPPVSSAPPPSALGTAAAIAEVAPSHPTPNGPSLSFIKKRSAAADRRDRLILYGGVGLVSVAVFSFMIWLFR